ncbi:unnamed protein product [Lota lota]
MSGRQEVVRGERRPLGGQAVSRLTDGERGCLKAIAVESPSKPSSSVVRSNKGSSCVNATAQGGVVPVAATSRHAELRHGRETSLVYLLQPQPHASVDSSARDEGYFLLSEYRLPVQLRITGEWPGVFHLSCPCLVSVKVRESGLNEV